MMKKITASIEDIPIYLKKFSEYNLEQVTSRDEMVKWFDGDWGTYWFLFKNPSDTARMDIVHQRNNTTRFGIYFGRKLKKSNKTIFDVLDVIITPYIPLNKLIKLCVENGIKFRDKEFTFADSLYNG